MELHQWKQIHLGSKFQKKWKKYLGIASRGTEQGFHKVSEGSGDKVMKKNDKMFVSW